MILNDTEGLGYLRLSRFAKHQHELTEEYYSDPEYMEEKLNQSPQEPEEEQVPQEPYRPRPWWQVWGARILLVIFILLVIMYYVNIARGGL